MIHLGAEALDRTLASVDLSMLEGRLRGQLDRGSILVTLAGKTVPHALRGSLLLFPTSAPGRSVQTYYVYFSAKSGDSKPAFDESTVSGADRNLVKNPGFELGQPLPDAWTRSGASDGVTFGLDDPHQGGLGKHCARMRVPATAPSNWRGWQQGVPVRPGHTYLVSAEVKCEDVKSGNVQVHLHRLQASGAMCQQEPMTSIGPPISGTTGWTRMSGLMTMPTDAATLQIHLTMNESGTVWHDNLFVAEVLPATLAGLEPRPDASTAPLRVWPVPAIVKVFPDDAPQGPIPPARINAARNELEPLQLAVRSRTAVRNVHVEVIPPVGPGKTALKDIEIGVVGFVPIDHPTSYYQSQSPEWHRKYPRGGGQSDGWPGLWPDPLLPQDHFDLKPDATQPVWITVSVGKDAPAGDYSGTVRLVGDGKPLASRAVRGACVEFHAARSVAREGDL